MGFEGGKNKFENHSLKKKSILTYFDKENVNYLV